MTYTSTARCKCAAKTTVIPVVLADVCNNPGEEREDEDEDGKKTDKASNKGAVSIGPLIFKEESKGTKNQFKTR